MKQLRNLNNTVYLHTYIHTQILCTKQRFRIILISFNSVKLRGMSLDKHSVWCTSKLKECTFTIAINYDFEI